VSIGSLVNAIIRNEYKPADETHGYSLFATHPDGRVVLRFRDGDVYWLDVYRPCEPDPSAYRVRISGQSFELMRSISDNRLPACGFRRVPGVSLRGRPSRVRFQAARVTAA
jgi:hypothetical protein